MSLKDKSEKELWDMLDKILEKKECWFGPKPALYYEIHQKIIRKEKEKDNEKENIKKTA